VRPKASETSHQSISLALSSFMSVKPLFLSLISLLVLPIPSLLAPLFFVVLFHPSFYTHAISLIPSFQASCSVIN
jgi:hypothetical protein